MQQLPTADLLKQISKDWRSYILVTLVMAVTFLFAKLTGATNTNISNCEEEKDSLRIEKRELVIRLNQVQQKYDDLHDKKDETIQLLDSLLRTKLEDKTKENLQNTKQ